MMRKAIALGAAALCCSLALLPASASAAPAPAWALSLTPMPSNFDAAASLQPEYLAMATNIGAAPTSGSAQLKVTLPTGLVPTKASAINTGPDAGDPSCAILLQEVTCETAEAFGSGRVLLAQVSVEVNAPEGTYDTKATISGGGALQAVSATQPTKVQEGPLDFDFLPGFAAPLINEDATPATLAGSHPYQQTVAFAFPTVNPGDGITNSGHPRDIYIELPRGLLGDPSASEVLCTEAQLTGSKSCPAASQVGVTDVTTIVGEAGFNGISTTPLFNMVPPPGTVAEIATDVADAGIFLHVQAGVRTDRDFGVQAATRDVLALGTQPIFAAQAQVWGDPSSELHDQIRGDCRQVKKPCPVTHQETAFITLPSHCQSMGFEVHADSWEKPAEAGFEERRASYESADVAGNPAPVVDCGALAFEPEIQSRPTTTLTDSPSGLDFALHQPQDASLGSRSPAALRDAAITLPAGMVVNASQASGLGACSLGQIGFTGTDEAGAPHFSKAPQSCPDAAKIGTLTATSPPLVRRNAKHEVEEDPETGKPILEPLNGSLYIAQPFANPFDSLIAVYLVVEDEKTGLIAKLAGEGELDPQTGQLTTRFRENPQLPLEDVSVHLFGGPRGALITPPICAAHTTAAGLTPWSAPEGKDAFPTDSFQTTQSPLGGACPSAEGQLPNAPKLSAGTLSPQAGAHSPLLFKLTREDGSQRLGKIEATLPTGLSAKLAGVATCQEQEIAKAISREAPEQGALEQKDPSCPPASELGTVIAAAGAGPTPYYTTGRAYLAPPYKGAPLSVVAIAPAIAGPFDLGTVVVRSALYLDPVTAQGRVVSDPLPQILQGVPVDLRSVSVRATRPNFTLNPTSCAEKSFGGQVLSALAAPAPLFERFQVGGCKDLPFKPKLTLRLFGPTNRGAHPRLRAELTAKPGEANIARTVLTLPRSEFIDQAHFRTICTRVQFAANQCPAGSVYGHVRAFSPLLDYPLEGAIYLRSSNNKLPDTVFALRGPPSQPIAIDAVGRVDSVKGRLRTTFAQVPDAPLTKVVVSLQGAKKGLFQNSTDICKGTHRASLKLEAQNGKVHDTQPPLKAQCGGKGKGGGGKGGGGGR